MTTTTLLPADFESAPKSIDEIITKNGHELILEQLNQFSPLFWLKFPDDIETLVELDEAIIYKRLVPHRDEETAFLVGMTRYGEEVKSIHTMPVIAITQYENKYIAATLDGRAFMTSNLSFSHIHPVLLITICQKLNEEGLGDKFGVPPFF